MVIKPARLCHDDDGIRLQYKGSLRLTPPFAMHRLHATSRGGAIVHGAVADDPNLRRGEAMEVNDNTDDDV